MRLAGILVLALLAGCPHGSYKQPSSMPSAAEVVDRLAKLRAARTAFSADTVMDYWLGKDRVKGEVKVMGTRARQVRFHAISPDESVLADMGCNGTDFAYVDMRNNCQLIGPCNRQSIASLLRVELEPEDFLALALGTPPVIASPTGTVTWDASKGYERVKLESAEGTQTIAIDARDGRWDVVASQLTGRDGKVMWSVENTDFAPVKDAAGVEHRLPGKTRFKAPAQEADLIVEWKQRIVNPTIDASKFVVPVPEGLPACGQRR